MIIYWKFIFLNSQIFNNKIIKLILMIYILWFWKIHTDRQIFCDLFLFMNSCCCIYWTFDNKIQRKNLRFSFFFLFRYYKLFQAVNFGCWMILEYESIWNCFCSLYNIYIYSRLHWLTLTKFYFLLSSSLLLFNVDINKTPNNIFIIGLD